MMLLLSKGMFPYATVLNPATDWIQPFSDFEMNSRQFSSQRELKMPSVGNPFSYL